MEKGKDEKDKYAFSRTMYIIEAALEYFVSILVTESYLAKVSTSIGISDTLTGILSSFVALGCVFRVLVVLIPGNKPVKSSVTCMCIINQMAFVLVYAVPVFPIGSKWKTVCFVLFLLIGQILTQVVFPPRNNWFMALVEDKKRGSFTANKEIVSLISGMLFSFLMGNIIDHFEADGNLNGAFVVIALTIFGLMLMHTATLLFSKEKPAVGKPLTVKDNLSVLFKNKNSLSVMLVMVLWSAATYATTPFYGTYRNNELGFSMTYNAVLSILYSITRAFCSRPMGKLADRTSFAKMLTLAFSVQGVAYLINVFTVPSNGKVFFTAYYLLYAVAAAGINSAALNLVFDYVPLQTRTVALAIQGTAEGLIGFLSTLVMSVPVSMIQKSGDTLFGYSVYAQQVLSAYGLFMMIVLVVYINTVVKKKKQINEPNSDTCTVSCESGS